MLLSVHKPKVAFFMTTTQTFETILTPDFAVSNILRIFAVNSSLKFEIMAKQLYVASQRVL